MTTHNAQRRIDDRDRGTGRTTRALAEARGSILAGRSVVFAVHHSGMALYVRALANQWDWDEMKRYEMRLGNARLRIVPSRDFGELRVHHLAGTTDLLLFDHAYWDHMPANNRADFDALARWIEPMEFG